MTCQYHKINYFTKVYSNNNLRTTRSERPSIIARKNNLYSFFQFSETSQTLGNSMKKIKIFLILSFCFFRILEANQGNTSSAMTVYARSLVDTLNVGLEDTINIGFSPGDIMMEVIQVPGDLTLNGVGLGVHQWNTDGTIPSLKVEVYRPDTAGYPFTSAGSMYSFGDTAESGWIGFAHPAENDSIAYPDTSSASNLNWNNFSAGTGACSNEPEVAGGQPLWGTKVLPAGNDALIPRPSGGSAGLFYVDFAGGGAQFEKDEYIAVVVSYPTNGAGDPADESTRILLNAADASYLYPSPGLQYFASSCSGPSGEHGWHIMPNAWKFQYVVDITGDIPPEIDIYHVGLSTTTGLPDPIPSWTEIKVMATANDYNPSGGSEGIEAVVLHYQLNSLTADTTSEYMSTAFNLVLQIYVYHTEIPGVSNGTTVYYWVSAQDVEGNISNTNKQSYIVGTLTTDNDVIPNNFGLYGNYPNPFNPITNIIYTMDTSSDVNINIHNIQGQLVKNLFIGNVNPGQRTISWDGTDRFAQSLPSGIYIYSIQSSQEILTGKMMLLK